MGLGEWIGIAVGAILTVGVPAAIAAYLNVRDRLKDVESKNEGKVDRIEHVKLEGKVDRLFEGMREIKHTLKQYVDGE